MRPLLWSFEGARASDSAAARLTAWAVIATGKHLFPFRTEKLSPLAPMVLGEQSPGRVGRRPLSLREAPRGASRSSAQAHGERDVDRVAPPGTGAGDGSADAGVA